MGVEDNKQHFIPESNNAYRRGVVLGLTMAEVGILIIFILLLLIGLFDWDRILQKEKEAGTTRIDSDSLKILVKAESTLTTIVNALALGNNIEPNSITPLFKGFDGLDSTQRGRNILSTMKNGGIAGAVDSLGDLIDNLNGALKNANEKLKNSGLGGTGERPCWVRPNGTIDYLYDVVLESRGIRMREIRYPEREKERGRLPMPTIDPMEVLSPGEFLRLTEPLYLRSLTDSCRYFVVIYDGTGPTEKETYKRLLRTVEGHFYKRLDLGASPF